MAKKVGQLKAEETKQEEEKVKGRQPFDVEAYGKANAGAVDADGLLTVVPTTFAFRKNVPMKKEQFASEVIYIKYQSLVAGQKAKFFGEKAKELAGKAERLEKFGSEKARRAASKIQKAKNTITELREQLLASGMDAADLDNLIANM